MTTRALIAALAGFVAAVAPGAASAASALTPGDVGQVIARVVQEAEARHAPANIAVVDRTGAVLAFYAMAGAPTALPVISNPKGPNATALVDGLNGLSALPGAVLLNNGVTLPAGTPLLPASMEAITKAITGAYLSTSGGNAFSSRTASQIVQDHFDPGTLDAPAGPLYGVQFSQLPCSDLSVRLGPYDGSSLTRGPHRSPLGLAADPGGFPLYKNGELVGGVGVKAVGPYGFDTNIQVNDHSIDEILALAGTIGLDAPAGIRADQISAGGLLLRYSDATPSEFLTNPTAAPNFASLPTRAGQLTSVFAYYNAATGLRPGTPAGSVASGFTQDQSGAINTATPPYLLTDGAGNVRYPASAGAGSGALTQAEVLTILRNAYAIALQTRAQIRNPPGQHAAVTISVVDVHGRILGIVSTPDPAYFGIDVSLQKARSALFFSAAGASAAILAAGVQYPQFDKFITAANAAFKFAVFSSGHAWSERAIGNIARDTLPDGIDGSPNGPLSLSAALTTPFSDGLQLDLILPNLVQHILAVAGASGSNDAPAHCTPIAPAAAMVPPVKGGAPLPILANGLQIFPGGFPIYRGNQLIGGIGVSGDGVDQDDLVGFLGLYNAGQQLGTGVGHAPPAIRASVLTADGVSPHYVNCPFAPFLNQPSQEPCSGK